MKILKTFCQEHGESLGLPKEMVARAVEAADAITPDPTTGGIMNMAEKAGIAPAKLAVRPAALRSRSACLRAPARCRMLRLSGAAQLLFLCSCAPPVPLPPQPPPLLLLIACCTAPKPRACSCSAWKAHDGERTSAMGVSVKPSS